MKKQKFKLSEYLKNNPTQGKLLLEHMHGYFKMYDLEHGASVSTVFRLLYIASPTPSIHKICAVCHISEATFYRHVSRFDSLAEKLVSAA